MPKRRALPAPIPAPSSSTLPTDPRQLGERAKVYAGASRAPNTLRGYAADWRHFETWCTAAGAEPLPASPEVLAAYLSACADADGAKVGTMQRRLSAIASAHRSTGQPSPTDDGRVREVWRGIRRALGVAQEGAQPVTADRLRALLASIPGEGLALLRDRALLLVGFHGAFRRSELAALEVGDVRDDDGGSPAVVVTLRRSKTDQEGRGSERMLCWQADDEVCPVRALRAWLEAAAITEGPIFRGVTKGGRLRAGGIHPNGIALVVKRAAAAAVAAGRLSSADGISAHSLRAGLATQAARDGAPERVIMRAGGWKAAETVRRYIRHGTLRDENVAKWLKLAVI